jgi:hypothetical protein
MALPTTPPFQPVFNYPNNKLYQYEVYPVLLNCTFTVASTDAGGLGITGLTGAGIANVFMHTTQTPGAGNYGVTNPNPPTGYVLVQMSNQFGGLMNTYHSVVSPATGSATSSVTANHVYTITTVGTGTFPGFPVGATPTVGATYISSSTTTLTGGSQVKAIGVSAVSSLEQAGPHIKGNSNIYQNGGSQVLYQFLAPTISGSAFDTPFIPTNPADGSIVKLSLYFSNSSITIAGE